MNKTIKIVAIAILSPVFLYIFLLLSSLNGNYYTYNYVVDSIHESSDQEKIQSRFYEIQYEDFNFNIEWYTYDNKEIKKGPYKLFMVMEPKSNIEYIKIDNLKITSSMNNAYVFDKITNWPVQIYKNKNNFDRQSFKFDNIFDFNFREKETIILEFKIIYKVNSTVEQEELIKLRFVPVKVKRWAPIV